RLGLRLSSFSFTATPTPALYTLSLHDALPISSRRKIHWKRGWHPYRSRVGSLERSCSGTHRSCRPRSYSHVSDCQTGYALAIRQDRKSTRLNSSHVKISYAVFCLKKKNKQKYH